MHNSQDALLDRLITITMDHYDRQTEVAITASSGGVGAGDGGADRQPGAPLPPAGPGRPASSMRAAMMIARVLASQGLSCDPAHPLVLGTCRDVLHLGKRCSKGENPASPDELPAMLASLWGSSAGRASRLRPSSPPRPKSTRCSYENRGRKGLQDIPTRSSLTSELENPQRKFLRAASLELKKSLCRKVRRCGGEAGGRNEAARLAEIEAEQAELLGRESTCSAGGQRIRTAAPCSGRPVRIAAAARFRVEVLGGAMATEDLPTIARPRGRPGRRATLPARNPCRTWRVDVSQVAPVESRETVWEAEAVVWQPNAHHPGPGPVHAAAGARPEQLRRPPGPPVERDRL